MRVLSVVVCALVMLGAAGPGSAAQAAVPTTDDVVVPASQPVDWLPGVQYYRGDLVLHRGLPYASIRTHLSAVGLDPGHAPAMWLLEDGPHLRWTAS